MAEKELKALIFDVDGTIADTERDGHRVAFNLAFDELGLDWSWSVELYGKLLSVTGGKERIRYYLECFNQEFKKPDDLDGFIAKLHQLKTQHYTDLMSKGDIPLRPGVERLLNEAREQGIRLAIATTTTPKNVEVLLTQLLGAESLTWFDVIAAGDIVSSKKPASAIYDYAIKELGLDASECLALEDSHNGILSSMAADLKTIVTINEYTKDHDFTGASLVLNHLGEPKEANTVISGYQCTSNYVDINCCREIVNK
ncbi:Xylulose-1,5-bisphosphate phosphatase CbbY, converts this Rubisco inhibiting byproduct to xylulose-5P [hydrothermal vent metagenome]|uniref:Xylulose-1,5-bisphosphate phosphatase CbbY, converts this Rubisco inhibiting byproduct to xylulose-5P n=1 Tax=hydrothermal vent metagenome TaxID=652676 RepID=A0A3B1AAM6_9ZZZZ